MSTVYHVQAPDGSTLHIEGPDNASDSDIQAAAAAAFNGSQSGAMPDDAFRAQLHTMLSAPKIDRAAVHSFVTSSGHADDPSFDVAMNYAEKHPGYGNTVAINIGHPGEPAIPDPRPTSFLTGLAEGMVKPIDKAAEYLETGLDKIGLAKPLEDLSGALGMAPTAEAGNADQQKYLAGLDTQGSAAGKFVGEGAGTMLATGGLGGPLVQGAVGGALLSDAKDGAGVAKDMALGVAGGAAGDVALRGLARLAAPVVNPAVRRLIDAGVPLTPGQIVGQNGLIGRNVKRLEDTAANLPIIGPAIRGARARGDVALNTAAINRALHPIGATLPGNLPAGHDAIAFAGDRLSEAYNRVLPTLSGTLDNSFSQRASAIMQRTRVPAEYQDRLDQVMTEASNAFSANRGQPGHYSGRTLRDTSERLGDIASGWRKSDDPYLRMIGEAAGQVRDQLHALARRQNPASAAELRAIDAGYANLVRVERAAAGTDTGQFTAGQLKTAVRQADGSVRKRQSARGEALMQDLSSDAATVMPGRVGEGGSNAVNSGAAVGGLLVGAAMGNPLAIKAVAIGGAGLAAYTRPGQHVLQTVLARTVSARQQYIADLIRRGLPVAAAGGATSAVTSAHSSN